MRHLSHSSAVHHLLFFFSLDVQQACALKKCMPFRPLCLLIWLYKQAFLQVRSAGFGRILLRSGIGKLLDIVRLSCRTDMALSQTLC